MDNLEKFIIENREEFNLHEPDPAIWERIQNSSEKQKVRKLNYRKIIWRAAAVLLIFGSSFMVSEYIHRGDNTMAENKLNRKINEIPQLAEANAYYTSMVNKKMGEVKTKLEDHPEVQEQIKNDFKDLDNMYNDLKKDLYDNVATQEIIEAMIQNYRLKLEILEDILNELSDKEKNNKDEKVEHEL